MTNKNPKLSDIVEAIYEENPIKIKEHVHEVVSQKAMEAIENRKIAIAKNYFGQNEEEESPEITEISEEDLLEDTNIEKMKAVAKKNGIKLTIHHDSDVPGLRDKYDHKDMNSLLKAVKKGTPGVHSLKL